MNTILCLQHQPISSIPLTPISSPPLSFGSVPPISTTWSSLGLSNPPPALPNTRAPSSSYSHPQLTTPLYSTIMSASHSPVTANQPIQSTTTIQSPINSTPPRFPQRFDYGFSSPSAPIFTHSHFQHHLDYNPYRPPRVDLPRFNGEDVVGWLAMAESHIRLHCLLIHK